MTRTCFTFSSRWHRSLHLGAARLALINWLYAEHCHGKMILRVDDASYCKSDFDFGDTAEILSWLGIDFSEGPYYSVHNKVEYQRAVETLLNAGAAYKDYATPEEINQNHKLHTAHTRQWMSHSAEDDKRFEAEGRNCVIRLKMPREKSQVILPLSTGGNYIIDLSQEHDFVIQRGKDNFTSYLTGIVDYAAHGVTHVFGDANGASGLAAYAFISGFLNIDIPQVIGVPPLRYQSGSKKFSIRSTRYDPRIKKLLDHGRRSLLETKKSYLPDDFHPSFLNFYKKAGFSPRAILHYLIATVTHHSSWLRVPRNVDIKDIIKLFDIHQISRHSDSFIPEKVIQIDKCYNNGN